MQPALKSPASGAENKLLGLEVLRFITAFAILVFHYRHFFFMADEPVGFEPERLPFYGLLRTFHDSGAFGVWVFWCISGYIFFWKYRDPIADGAVGGWKFFTLRFSRLYPLHLVTLLLVATLQPAYFHLHGHFFVYENNDLPHFLTQLFMASEWGIVKGYSFDGPIWSISVEVLVYFLFFLMLRATRSWLLNLAIVIVCLAAPALNASGQVTNCLGLFYVGGLAAIARRAVVTVKFRAAIEACVWLAAAALPLLVFAFMRDQLDRFDYPLFLTYTPILLFCLTREFSAPAPVQQAIEAAGNMTYSSYLLHFPLQLAIVLGFGAAGRPVPAYETAFFMVYLLTTLLASYLAYRFFEAPAQRLIRGMFLPARAQTAEPANAAFRRASSV